MARIATSLLLLTFAVAGLALNARAQQEPTSQAARQDASQPRPSGAGCPHDRLLVKLRPGADPATVVGRVGGTIVQTIPGIGVQVVTVPDGQGQQAIDALAADPEVQYAEADQMVQATEGQSNTSCP